MSSGSKPVAVASLDFETLVHELDKPVVRYLQRYVGDRAVAEDLRQETWIRVRRGLASFAGASKINTWIWAIASRVAADYLRHPDRQRQLVRFEDIEEPVDTQLAVDERMEIDEMNACVRQVIDGLPQDYRGALLLHDMQGLTAQQTAQAMECSLANAKIRIHRARERLRGVLSVQCSFYSDSSQVLRCERKQTVR